MQAEDDIIRKINWKISSKYEWEYCDVIPLLPLLHISHRLPILHMYKIFFYMKSIEKLMNPFSIGYIANPILHVNKSFRHQVEQFLKETFQSGKQYGIKM